MRSWKGEGSWGKVLMVANTLTKCWTSITAIPASDERGKEYRREKAGTSCSGKRLLLTCVMLLYYAEAGPYEDWILGVTGTLTPYGDPCKGWTPRVAGGSTSCREVN